MGALIRHDFFLIQRVPGFTMHFLSFFTHQTEFTGRVIICDCLELVH